MSDRRWVLNRKCFAALRAIGAGALSRWEYMHVGPKGVTCTDTISLIRVSLPDEHKTGFQQAAGTGPTPVIFTLEQAKMLGHALDKKDTVTMPVGLPAKTGQYTVPNYDATIPNPDDQTATLAVDAGKLIEILKAACEVTEHSKHLVRLRFYGKFIRIDAHRDAGGQEFMGLLVGTDYNGTGIPGDASNEKTVNGKFIPPSEDAVDGALTLPLFEGRKFREVEE